MAESFKGMVIGFVIVGIFFFCLVSLTIQFQSDNKVNNSLLNDPEYSELNKTFSSMNITLSSVQKIAGVQRESTEQEAHQKGFGSLVSFAIKDSAKAFSSMVIVIPNLLFGTIKPVLGLDDNPSGGMALILNVIIGIIVISLLFLGWRLFKAGS